MNGSTNRPIPGRQHCGGWYGAASPLGASHPTTPSRSTTAGDGGRGAARRWWQLSLLFGRKFGDRETALLKLRFKSSLQHLVRYDFNIQFKDVFPPCLSPVVSSPFFRFPHDLQIVNFILGLPYWCRAVIVSISFSPERRYRTICPFEF